MRKAFTDTVLEVGQIDPKLVVLVGDISHFSLQPFAQACPGRYYNIGIMEPTIVSMSAGLSHSGLHPVAHTIAPFLIERSFEQIKMGFAYQNLGGNLISVGSAFDYSGLGCSHHSYGDLGMIKSLPNTQVIYPASPQEFNLLFKETYNNTHLTYFRLPGEKHGIDIPKNQIRLGKGIVIKPGKNLSLIAVGPHLKTAMNSIPIFSKHHIDVEVLYFPTLKPFDEETVRESVKKTGHVIVIEEHVRVGSTCEDVLFAIHNLGPTKCSFLHIPDSFQRGYGSYQDHLNAIGLTAENLYIQGTKLLSGDSH